MDGRNESGHDGSWAGKPKKRQPHAGKHLIAVAGFARGGDHRSRTGYPYRVLSCGFEFGFGSAEVQTSRVETGLSVVERIDAGLADLFVDCRRSAADADTGNALTFDSDGNASFDTDEPAGTDRQMRWVNSPINHCTVWWKGTKNGF
ncbi:MAG: hypothetical protein WD688_02635 [Candidatus Binatia bacterium]